MFLLVTSDNNSRKQKKGRCTMKKKNQGITRREFIKKTGVAGAAIGTVAMVPSFARKAIAAKRDYILIGHPNSPLNNTPLKKKCC